MSEAGSRPERAEPTRDYPINHEGRVQLFSEYVAEYDGQPHRQAYMVDALGIYTRTLPNSAEYGDYQRLNAAFAVHLARVEHPNPDRIAAFLLDVEPTRRWSVLADLITLPGNTGLDVHINAWWATTARDTDEIVQQSDPVAASVARLARLEAAFALLAHQPEQAARFGRDHLLATARDFFDTHYVLMERRRQLGADRPFVRSVGERFGNSCGRLGIWELEQNYHKRVLYMAHDHQLVESELAAVTNTSDTPWIHDDPAFYIAIVRALNEGKKTIDEAIPIPQTAVRAGWLDALKHIMPDVWRRAILTSDVDHCNIDDWIAADAPNAPVVAHGYYERMCSWHNHDMRVFQAALTIARMPEANFYHPEADPMLQTLSATVEQLHDMLGTYTSDYFVSNDLPPEVGSALARLEGLRALYTSSADWHDAATETEAFLTIFELLQIYNIVDTRRLQRFVEAIEPRYRSLYNRASQRNIALAAWGNRVEAASKWREQREISPITGQPAARPETVAIVNNYL